MLHLNVMPVYIQQQLEPNHKQKTITWGGGAHNLSFSKLQNTVQYISLIYRMAEICRSFLSFQKAINIPKLK